MISYQPKDWFTFIFRFHKADTLRKLAPLILSIIVYTIIVAYFELEYLNLAENSEIKNISMMHSLLSFVISLLLVFRTNTAYERWWEGRKLWGQLVNSSRSLAVKLQAILPKDYGDRTILRQLIPAYAFVLAYHLKSDKTKKELPGGLEWLQLRPATHFPNQVLKKIVEIIQNGVNQGVISPQQWLGLNVEIQAFADVCGACERIRNTPIPYSYSVFLKKFIFFYVMTLPFSMVFLLGYWSVPVTAFIFYALASMELIGEEIEEPFGQDANDLPTLTISENIQKNIMEIIDSAES